MTASPLARFFGALSAILLALGATGLVYLVAALLLGAHFIRLALGLHRQYADAQAMRCFRWSIHYLTWLFAALLIDHYLLISLRF